MFDPIRLTEKTITAYGFQKSNARYLGNRTFIRSFLAIKLRPLTKSFYCLNIPASPDFNYLHELQDFFSNICRSRHYETTDLMDFIINYGSSHLRIKDD
jgi:hypothetical protein